MTPRAVAEGPRFTTKLIVEDNLGLPFTLYIDLGYVTAIGASGALVPITVPAGFMTDLASIPSVFWRILPPVGRYDKAAVVHDYLYQYSAASRKQADDVLREAMGVLGVGRFSRWLIYSGVRIGGWRPWRAYRTQEQPS